MLKIEVKIDVAKFTSAGRQIPFAAALALTRTAQDVQAEVRRQLPQRFTIRNNWVSGGIRIKQADKQNLEAIVYSRDKFMQLQEVGGVHVPQSGSSLAIPLDTKPLVPRSRRPRALLGRPGVFRARIGGLDALWQRVRGHKGKRRRGERVLKLLFVFKPSVPVRARFGFIDTARRVVRERFARQMELAIAFAIRTAR